MITRKSHFVKFLLVLSFFFLNIINIGCPGTDPYLKDLSISETDSSSITLDKPVLMNSGSLTNVSISAYIGIEGTIKVSGKIVSGSVQGPVNVKSSGYKFQDLNPNTNYRIVVVASTSNKYWVSEINQSTKGIAPVLNNLSASVQDSQSISLSKPSLSTAGNPVPAVRAYIGLDGTISVSGTTVTGSIQGPIDVSSSDYLFNALSPNFIYMIIVVAENSEGYSVKQIKQATKGIAPVLNDISVGSCDSTSISILKPSLSTEGNPAPQVKAYIGLNGAISVSGETISDSIQGPIDVSQSGYQFTGLDVNSSYRIIVVATNKEGYSVKQIIQSTKGVAPVLIDIVVNSFDSTSISIAKPTFASAGNPTPEIKAYIGLDGVISVSGAAVTGFVQGPVDVSLGGCQFSGLSLNSTYRIVVVAQNIEGYFIQEIVQATKGIAPVLNDLVVDSFDTGMISIASPTFSTAGNPAPQVSAFVGIDGTISVSGAAVTGSLQGPVDVSLSGCQFKSLAAYTTYKVVVVAQNKEGYSVKEIVLSTKGIAPVLNKLVVTSIDPTSITIACPTFSTAGVPNPTVQAYIGPDDQVSVSGDTVTGSTEGPVDVSLGGYQFNGLIAGTKYRIIVIASNQFGRSVKALLSYPKEGYPIERNVGFGFTITNNTNKVVYNPEFYVYAPVKQTSLQYCDKISSSNPYELIEDSIGNQVLKFSYDLIAPYEIKTLSVQATVYFSNSPNQVILTNQELYLLPEQYIESDNSNIVNIAEGLGTNEDVFDWILINITKSSGDYEAGALYANNYKSGSYIDLSDLFVALCRAKGIPSRTVAGYTYSTTGNAGALDFYRWSEFYENGTWNIADFKNDSYKLYNKQFLATRIVSRNSTPILPTDCYRFYVKGEGLKTRIDYAH
jgi:hypothetical protein